MEIHLHYVEWVLWRNVLSWCLSLITILPGGLLQSRKSWKLKAWCVEALGAQDGEELLTWKAKCSGLSRRSPGLEGYQGTGQVSSQESRVSIRNLFGFMQNFIEITWPLGVVKLTNQQIPSKGCLTGIF